MINAMRPQADQDPSAGPFAVSDTFSAWLTMPHTITGI
jgi:hypothetical protein